MGSRLIGLGLAAWLTFFAGRGSAQDKPALHELTSFMTKGAFAALDEERARHRLTLQELDAAGLDGRPRPVADVLEFMAGYERLHGRVDEPLQVRGDMHVSLTPNTTGAEAYTTCFVAMTYNGLVLSGSGQDLVLVRPETRPGLTVPKRTWDATRILSTRLFRLGYLAADPIFRRYSEQIGTGQGHVVLVRKANVVIATDTDAALDQLGAWIDSEIIAAMGDPASGGPAGGPPLPSPGAVASRECIHFYLQAFARSRRIRLFPARQPGTVTRHYPEVDVWLSDPGYAELLAEYRRVEDLIPIAREAVTQGWIDPRPDRTLTPAAQRRLEIRYGLVSPLPSAERARTPKKSARRKR
jgi:hypothetical protein